MSSAETVPSHPHRTLSPITELTTPISLRTLQLPLTDAEYEPEGGGGGRADGGDDDGRSVYSNDSDDTVKEALGFSGAMGPLQRAVLPDASLRQRTMSLPVNVPKPPPRSADRPPAGGGSLRSIRPISTSPTKSPPATATSSPSSPIPIPSPARQAPAPGGLLPPPRSISAALKPKLIKRITPPPSPSPYGPASDEARRRYTDRYWPRTPEEKAQEEKEAREREYTEGKAKPNMAGVGAGGRSRPGSLKSRPSSFHAMPPDPSSRVGSPVKSPTDLDLPAAPMRPALNPQHSHPTLHNIPFFLGPEPSPKKDSPPSSRPTSPPNSLKKPRPHSFHASRSTVARSRPSSFSGSPSKDGVSMGMVAPAVGLDPVTTHAEAQAEVVVASPESTSFSPSDNPYLSLGPQQAAISRSSSLQSSPNEARNPAGRRTRVPSILSSFFGGERAEREREPKPSEPTSRKLSKRSRSTRAFPVQSPGATSPLALMDESVLPAEVGGAPTAPVHAIRTSGIFGIRDDGSEVSARGNWHGHGGSHGRSSGSGGSQAGSPHTQTDGVRRMLYVENQGVAVAEEEDEHEIEPGVGAGEVAGVEEDGNESEARTDWEAYHTPMDAGSPISERAQIAQGLGLVPGATSPEPVNGGGEPHAQEQVQAPPAVMVTSTSTSITPSLGAHAELQARQSPSDFYKLGSFSPQQPTPNTPSPTATEAQLSSGTHLPLTTPPKQVDEATQTSAVPSPTRSTRSPRPLPQPPSRQTSPRIHTPQPTFIPPPPPATSPAADLPLLIASHLLSTHAAALLRHSSNMKEVSEVMHKMAKESLDWGGILMGMADKTPKPGSSAAPGMDGLPRIGEDAAPGPGAGYDGVPLPRAGELPFESMARAHRMLVVSQQPSVYSQPPPQRPDAYDPIQGAYDSLTAQPVYPHLPVGVDARDGGEARGRDGPGHRPPPLQALRGDVRRRKADSLPADLLKEAQRLGKEGWQSLHAAEEAWATAMSSLAEMVERGELRAGGSNGGGGPRGQEGSGETGAGWSGEATVSPSMAYPDPRDPRFTLSPNTVLSYPLGSDSHLPLPSPLAEGSLPGGGVDPNKSFIDMFSPQSGTFPHTPSFPFGHVQVGEDPNATVTREQRPRASFGRVSGHAFSNPLIQPQDAAPAPAPGIGRAVSAQPVSTLRPHPQPHTQPQSPGYTDDQLHSSVIFPRPAGAFTPNSTFAMEGRSRLGSTLTATSVGTGAGTDGGRSTLKGRKLLKKGGQPQGVKTGQEGVGSTLGGGTGEGTVGKRHWWNRRRSEVEVAGVL